MGKNRNFNRLLLQNWMAYKFFFHITEVRIKCNFVDIFGETVDLSLHGLTGVNSSGQFQAKKCPKKIDFYMHLNRTYAHCACSVYLRTC